MRFARLRILHEDCNVNDLIYIKFQYNSDPNGCLLSRLKTVAVYAEFESMFE